MQKIKSLKTHKGNKYTCAKATASFLHSLFVTTMSQSINDTSSSKKRNHGSSRRVQGGSSNNHSKPANNNNNNNNKHKNNHAHADYIPWNRNIVSEATFDENAESGNFDTCLICAERYSIVALSSCGHRTCHKCALRQKALFKNDHCLICRSEYEALIFTYQVDQEYAHFEPSMFAFSNAEYNFHFVESEAAKTVSDLLKYKCPMNDTNEEFQDYKAYNNHLKKAHNRMLCIICAEYKHEFPSEMHVFSHDQLKSHSSKGDPKNGFFGHPMCQFCSGKRFYSDDELYKHLREHHERCHICHQMDPNNPQWFKDYDQLFDHFRSAHYVCTQQSCLDAKFVVFKTEIDLQAHLIQEHNAGKNLNLMDSSARNMRRFQSELSTFQPSFMRNGNEEEYVRSQSLGGRHNQNTNSDTGDSNIKRLRLEERARHYLHYNSTQFDKFTKINSDFSNSDISASDLHERYKMLFSGPEHDISLLIYEFANLFPVSSKKNKELLEIYEEINGEKQKADLAMKFPPLNGGGSSNSNFTNSWAGNPSKVGSSRASRMNFPALPTAAPKTVLKSTRSPTIGSSVSIGSQKKKLNTPSFQDIYGTPAAKPLPSLSNVKTTVAPAQTSNKSAKSSKNIDQSKFPPLPAVVAKPKAPLVNPVRTPGNINFQAAMKAGPTKTYDPFDVENLLKQVPQDKGKGKKGKKQLLMHIGI